MIYIRMKLFMKICLIYSGNSTFNSLHRNMHPPVSNNVNNKALHLPIRTVFKRSTSADSRVSHRFVHIVNHPSTTAFIS